MSFVCCLYMKNEESKKTEKRTHKRIDVTKRIPKYCNSNHNNNKWKDENKQREKRNPFLNRQNYMWSRRWTMVDHFTLTKHIQTSIRNHSFVLYFCCFFLLMHHCWMKMRKIYIKVKIYTEKCRKKKRKKRRRQPHNEWSKAKIRNNITRTDNEKFLHNNKSHNNEKLAKIVENKKLWKITLISYKNWKKHAQNYRTTYPFFLWS